MSKIAREDFEDVKIFWNKYGEVAGTEVVELIDSQTGIRSILIKEVKVNVSEAKLCDI
tara:strand:- start:37545 stop:37718 length:174 start_codon:yes stop_codon:yes gene_type:complete